MKKGWDEFDPIDGQGEAIDPNGVVTQSLNHCREDVEGCNKTIHKVGGGGAQTVPKGETGPFINENPWTEAGIEGKGCGEEVMEPS